MKRLDSLKKHLRSGRVYRRADLAQWSKSVDRHMHELVEQGGVAETSKWVVLLPQEIRFWSGAGRRAGIGTQFPERR